MKTSTYKKFLRFANLSYKAYLLNHEIVKELKEYYGDDEIEEYLLSSNILQDAGVNGQTADYKIFIDDIKRSLESNKIQKEAEERL
ncbi:MAG: hypothetical protein ACTSQL_01055 [Promethearchaeota archaeon]